MTQALKPDHSHPGATQALSLSTIAFTVCFAVWTIFSIIGIRIKDELGLTETEFGLLIGMPILTGSLVRMLLGIWTDRYGGRLVYTLTMLAAAGATFLLAFATIYGQMLVAALGVGLAGGSFAVGVASADRQQPESEGNVVAGNNLDIGEPEPVGARLVMIEEDRPGVPVAIDPLDLDRFRYVVHDDVVGAIRQNPVNVALADGVGPLFDLGTDFLLVGH